MSLKIVSIPLSIRRQSDLVNYLDRQLSKSHFINENSYIEFQNLIGSFDLKNTFLNHDLLLLNRALTHIHRECYKQKLPEMLNLNFELQCAIYDASVSLESFVIRLHSLLEIFHHIAFFVTPLNKIDEFRPNRKLDPIIERRLIGKNFINSLKIDMPEIVNIVTNDMRHYCVHAGVYLHQFHDNNGQWQFLVEIGDRDRGSIKVDVRDVIENAKSSCLKYVDDHLPIFKKLIELG